MLHDMALNKHDIGNPLQFWFSLLCELVCNPTESSQFQALTRFGECDSPCTVQNFVAQSLQGQKQLDKMAAYFEKTVEGGSTVHVEFWWVNKKKDMHRGLDVLDVSLPSSGATVWLSSSHLTKAGGDGECTRAIRFMTTRSATEQVFNKKGKVVLMPPPPSHQ